MGSPWLEVLTQGLSMGSSLVTDGSRMSRQWATPGPLTAAIPWKTPCAVHESPIGGL